MKILKERSIGIWPSQPGQKYFQILSLIRRGKVRRFSVSYLLFLLYGCLLNISSYCSIKFDLSGCVFDKLSNIYVDLILSSFRCTSEELFQCAMISYWFVVIHLLFRDYVNLLIVIGEESGLSNLKGLFLDRVDPTFKVSPWVRLESIDSLIHS